MSQLQSHSRLSWERFVIDLELLDFEAPTSLTPLVASLNQVLWPEATYDQLLRELNFMVFEVQHRTASLAESDKIKELNRYFFCEKGFAIANAEDQLKDPAWQLIQVLSKKEGSGLMVGLIYLHLANQLDLPLFMVFSPQFNLVKWVNPKKNYFLDLSRKGLPLDEESVVAQISNAQSIPCPDDQKRLFEILPNRLAFIEYAEALSRIFNRQADLHKQHTTINAQLLIEDDNLDLIAQRALLRKRLGFIKEALSDLRRYFSFIEKNQAPIELQKAFRDLIHLEGQSLRDPLEILH